MNPQLKVFTGPMYSDDEITITYGTSREGISLTTHGFVSLATVTFQDGLLVNYTL